MRIVSRRTVRSMMLLLVACSTFIAGLTAFYFHAEAAAFLFKPKQSAPETTQILTPSVATPPVFQFAPLSETARKYQTTNNEEWSCENCVQDSDCGLCEALSGEYINYQYAYMLTIPEEMQAMQAPPPAPNHGFMARLFEDPDTAIYVDGSYDSGFTDSLNKAARAGIEGIKGYGTNITVLKRNEVRLDKRAAIRYVVKYTDTSTGLIMIEDKIISLRKDCPGEESLGIIYEISLQTPADRYEANRRALEKILKRWKELELDCC